MKSAEQSELHSFPIYRRLAILRFGYLWACVAVGGNVERGKFPESVSYITVFSGRRTWWKVVVGCRMFKIMVPLSRM